MPTPSSVGTVAAIILVCLIRVLKEQMDGMYELSGQRTPQCVTIMLAVAASVTIIAPNATSTLGKSRQQRLTRARDKALAPCRFLANF